MKTILLQLIFKARVNKKMCAVSVLCSRNIFHSRSGQMDGEGIARLEYYQPFIGTGLGPYHGRWFQEPDTVIKPVAKPMGPAERLGHAWPNIVVEDVCSASVWLRQGTKSRRW